RRDVPDRALVTQGFEDVHRLLARHGEDVLAALGRQALDEEAGRGPRGGRGHDASLRSSGGHPAILPAMTEVAGGTLPRLAPLTPDPSGGNPAGVWIGEALPDAATMQAIAADVGYSESAFLAPDGSGLPGRFVVRYYSALAEVRFCGHATIAAGV